MPTQPHQRQVTTDPATTAAGRSTRQTNDVVTTSRSKRQSNAVDAPVSNKRQSNDILTPPSNQTQSVDIEDAGSATPEQYVSPLKRIKLAIESKVNKTVLRTADELKSFIRSTEPAASNGLANVALTARVVWTSFENCKTGPVARMHLIDTRADDEFVEMQQCLRDRYNENKAQVDAELMTASIYGVDEKTKGMPPDGTLITIRSMWALKLFLNRACQLTTSLADITIEIDP